MSLLSILVAAEEELLLSIPLFQDITEEILLAGRVLGGALSHLLYMNRKMKQSKNIKGLMGALSEQGCRKEKDWKIWLRRSWEKTWWWICRDCYAIRCPCPGICAGIGCKHPLETSIVDKTLNKQVYRMTWPVDLSEVLSLSSWGPAYWLTYRK